VHVSVVGEFNCWSTTANPMERIGDRWEAFVDLPPGLQPYCYFSVDSDEDSGQPKAEILCAGARVWVPRAPIDAKTATANALN
jgi:hypothetical protein